MDKENLPFCSEKDLVKKFTCSYTADKLCELLVDIKNPLVEFATYNGIADVVYCCLTKDWENNNLKKINPSWAYALKELPYRKKFSLEDFAKWTGTSLVTSKDALVDFQVNGFIETCTKSEHWFKVRQPKPLASTIIAIEAKLKNWKKALYQATRYKDFSNYSWVLLDNSHVRSALSNFDEFSKNNVGLASFSTNNKLEIYFSPIFQKPKSKLSYWKANASIGTALANSN